jgi:hypothetical protein
MKRKLSLHRLTVRNLEPETLAQADGGSISIPHTYFCPTRGCHTLQGPSCYNTCLGGMC